MVFVFERIITAVDCWQVLKSSISLRIAFLFILAGSGCCAEGFAACGVSGLMLLLLLTLRLVHTIVDDSGHEVFLMRDSLSLSPQTVFKNRLLVNVQRLKLLRIQQVFRSILQKLIPLNARLYRYELRI